jgi:Na+/H+ antiporter NhaD/arsenite permease-like protein
MTPAPWQSTAAILIFALTYAIISARSFRLLNLNRPAGVLLGSCLMVLVAGMPVSEAYAAIDLNTLTLLLGMMLIVAYLALAGFFEWVAWRIHRSARSPGRLLALLMTASAALSALFVNDTICLLMTPLVLRVVEKRNPVPYLLGLVMAANIGGLATLVGNPQNMLVGVFSGIPFFDFTLRMAPIAAVSIAIAYGVLRLLYRAEFARPWESEPLPEPPLDRAVAARVLALVAAMMAAFLLPVEGWLGIEASTKLPLIAIVGGTAAFLIGRYDPARALAAVEWPLLLFFAGLFIVVEGVSRTGFLESMHGGVKPMLGSLPAFCGFVALLSNVVSNVPLIMVARHWIAGYEDPTRMWYAIAMASTLAGNLTIFGSVANIIVLELAKGRVKIGFFEYLRAGLPVTLATLAVGAAFLAL